MHRTNPVGVILTALAAIAVLGGLSLSRGGLYMDRYEGDVLHLIEIVMRMAEGQRPHLDFMTPLGYFAAWPIARFVEAGFGIGMSIHLAQVSVAVVLASAVVWAGWSRFAPGLSHLFVVVCMILVLAIVHGEADPNVSLSMHYNRWSWALGFVALTLAILPNIGTPRPVLDGIVIGAVLAAVVLIKVTYLVALAPAIILALLLRGQGRTLIVGLLTGLAALALSTLYTGWAFWPAYAADLLTTARSEVRPYPGNSLNQVMTAPLYLGIHMLALLAVVLLRQGRQSVAGLVVLVLLPGVVYVTFQNFGNDPQWAVWLGLALLMMRPDAGLRNARGWDLRQATTIVGVVLAALASPSFLNMGFSPVRHFAEDAAGYAPMFPRSAQHDDFFIPDARAFQVNLMYNGEGPDGPLDGATDRAARDDPTFLAGEELEVCSIQNGMTLWFESTAQELEREGFADGRQIMLTDLLSPLAMFSDGLTWVRNGAPWWYGGAPGIENADLVVIPLCAISPKVRRLVIEAIEASGVALHEVYRSPRFILLEKT